MTRWQANLLLLFAALIWGGTFTVQKVSGDVIGPYMFTGLRFALGAICLIPFMLKERARLLARASPDPMDHWWLFFITGCVLAGAATVQHLGILQTSIANAGFLTTLYVPLTPLLAITLFRRRPHWIVWPGAFGCLCGTYILSGGNLTALGLGDTLVLASAILWALHILMISLCMDRIGAPLSMALVQFTAAALIGIVAGLALENNSTIKWSEAWWIVGFAGVVAVGVGFTLQVLAQRYSPPSDAAIMLSMEAVFAAVVGAIILGETMELHELIGCGIILAAVILVEIVPTLWRPQAQ